MHRASARLITMPHSHYAEKARWALDWSGLAYREERHLPLLHRWATRRAGGGSVPVLVHADGNLTDSTAIVRHADAGRGLLYPLDPPLRQNVDALVQRFDEELGPHTRRWAYSQVLANPALLSPMVSCGVPNSERLLLPVVMPIFVLLVPRAFRITPQSSARSLERVHALFEEIGKMLADGRRFLVGEQFSAADLSFAALAAPALLPPQTVASYPALDAVPALMRAEVLRLREMPAGRFAMRLFAEERRTPRS